MDVSYFGRSPPYCLRQTTISRQGGPGVILDRIALFFAGCGAGRKLTGVKTYHYPEALDFAKESGCVYKADLTFRQLLDIKSDWGWTFAPLLAFAVHSECLTRGIPLKHEDFEPFLGPSPWSLSTLDRRKGISPDEQKALCQLLRKHGFDGVRYPNQFEPHASLRRIAYFVSDPEQIHLREVRDAKDFLLAVT